MKENLLVGVLGLGIISGCSQLEAKPTTNWTPVPHERFQPILPIKNPEPIYDWYSDELPTRPLIKIKNPRIKSFVTAKNGSTSPRISGVVSKAVTKKYALKLVGSTQFPCLDKLWTRESNWNYKAYNKYSGAYGIPQAVPGSKMKSAGSDWRTNPLTQVRWGVRYIKNRYGSPCGALAFWKVQNWY